jgi:hypothetical protein
MGVHAERVPLSGATHYQGGGHDVDIYPYGLDAGALVGEVKARKDGAGFVTLKRWLGETTCCSCGAIGQSRLWSCHGVSGGPSSGR